MVFVHTKLFKYLLSYIIFLNVCVHKYTEIIKSLFSSANIIQYG
jgi:hypothetical protein